MYDRGNNRSQGGYNAGTDAFMDRFQRMGQQDAGYGQDSYGQSRMRRAAAPMSQGVRGQEPMDPLQGAGQYRDPAMQGGHHQSMGQQMNHMQGGGQYMERQEQAQPMPPIQQQASQMPPQQPAMPQQMQQPAMQQSPQMQQPAMPQVQQPAPVQQVVDLEELRVLADEIRARLTEMHAIFDKSAEKCEASVAQVRDIVESEDEKIRDLVDAASSIARETQEMKMTPAPVPNIQIDTDAIAMAVAQTTAQATSQATAQVTAQAASAQIEAVLDARFEDERRARESERAQRDAMRESREREREDRRAQDERRAEERANLENARREADVRRQDEMQQLLADLQEETAKLSAQMEGIAQNLGNVGDMSGITDQLNERANATDKNTHDVGVRIYRNVQASMNDYLAKQTSTLDTAITGLNQRMEAMEDAILHKKSAATPMTIALFVMGIVNLGLLVAYILTHF